MPQLPRLPRIRRLLAAGLAALVLASTAHAPAANAAPAGAAVSTDAAASATVTAAAARTAEQRRTDRVRTPKLRWYKCYGWAQCATARLPLDYDDPDGPTTEVAVLRVKARDPQRRIGSLFVNPGGPGGSATGLALAAPMFLSSSVTERFDVVGIDPRGVGFSDNVRCFTGTRAQTVALRPLTTMAFPVTAAETKRYLAASRKLARGCSTTGRPLSGAMSTAETARDMDVIRRAVGDRKLTYLGFSYGSVLGEYYANMFPDRIRALAIDGVINPSAWAGTAATRTATQDDRLRSADGAYVALREIFRRCDAAGPAYCEAAPSSAGKFATAARRLKAEPIDFGYGLKLSYADFVGTTLGLMYSTMAPELVGMFTAAVHMITSPAGATAADVAAARGVVRRQLGRDFQYLNDAEAYAGVMCTDGLHPAKMSTWPQRAARADRRAPYFGRAWAWASAPCATDAWTVRDPDAYRGPFNRRTSATVLIVGSFHDPATAYVGAKQTAAKMPNSRLLSSDNWGHTAYGTNECVTASIDAYLLRRALPARGTICRIAEQPFSVPLEEGMEPFSAGATGPAQRVTGTKEQIAARGLPAAGGPKQLPPVSSGLPGVVAR